MEEDHKEHKENKAVNTGHNRDMSHSLRDEESFGSSHNANTGRESNPSFYHGLGVTPLTSGLDATDIMRISIECQIGDYCFEEQQDMVAGLDTAGRQNKKLEKVKSALKAMRSSIKKLST
jgi:hypothetical protein